MRSRPQRPIVILIVTSALLAAASGVYRNWGRVSAGFYARVWAHIPVPIADFAVSMGSWVAVIVLVLACVLTVRSIITSARERVDGGASVALLGAGGGWWSMRTKLLPTLPPVLRSAVVPIGVRPRDRRIEAVEPLSSRLDANATHVDVPPGQSNRRAALAAHAEYKKTYNPVIGRALRRVSRVLWVIHQGGYTGSIAAASFEPEVAASAAETVVLVMGDSPEPMANALADGRLYAKALAARKKNDEPQYAWTSGEPRLVEVSS